MSDNHWKHKENKLNPHCYWYGLFLTSWATSLLSLCWCQKRITCTVDLCFLVRLTWGFWIMPGGIFAVWCDAWFLNYLSRFRHVRQVEQWVLWTVHSGIIMIIPFFLEVIWFCFNGSFVNSGHNFLSLAFWWKSEYILQFIRQPFLSFIMYTDFGSVGFGFSGL